ncbi:SDR family oxidoreductase [Paralimibaculum aggregatum]|uniref:SDR family oxidoreductase n=1 Tax=Paralimibaculum aggregatum TaxID=3036245 RepID=A0ABQ6LRJ2_9RHOB|nr:SDR family oxidoreductase [Limibaculum sp. NKW23]GMG84263.1 SDR family oxidoreductase [Limibaculum sp. NKW23]
MSTPTLPLAGRHAIVTGASSGIGAATVRALAGAGAAVTALARRADRLEALAAETGCTPLACDIRDGTALEAALAPLAPDILVNNAGLGAGISGLMGASRAEIAQTIDTNVTALLDTLRILLPGMAARRRGHVVNIGSVAGLYPILSAVYGGSKGAVRLISQNLRLELADTGIRVTEICPGRVTTEFYDASVPDPAARAALKDTGIRELDPEDIAAAILYATSAPEHVNISTIELQPRGQAYGGVRFNRDI